MKKCFPDTQKRRTFMIVRIKIKGHFLTNKVLKRRHERFEKHIYFRTTAPLHLTLEGVL